MKQFTFTIDLNEGTISLSSTPAGGPPVLLAQASLAALRGSENARDAWVMLCGGTMMAAVEQNV